MRASLDRRRSLGAPFRAVWLSVAISGTGDGMFLTAFPLLATAMTRDAVLIVGVTVASRLPWLLFSLVTDAIADRFDRRRLMVLADIVRCAVVGGLGFAVLADDARIWLLYLCAFALGIAETLHANAAQAILPVIVEPEQLVAANARLTGTQVMTEQFVGPPLGAALYGAASSVPFLVDAVSFGVSAGLIASLPNVHGVERPTTGLLTDDLGIFDRVNPRFRFPEDQALPSTRATQPGSSSRSSSAHSRSRWPASG